MRERTEIDPIIEQHVIDLGSVDISELISVTGFDFIAVRNSLYRLQQAGDVEKRARDSWSGHFVFVVSKKNIVNRRIK